VISSLDQSLILSASPRVGAHAGRMNSKESERSIQDCNHRQILIESLSEALLVFNAQTVS